MKTKLIFITALLLASAATFWSISGCGGGGAGGSGLSPSTPAELPISIEGIDNKTGVDIESHFEFSFLEAIDPDTVTEDTFYLSVGSSCDITTRVAATINVSADNKSITLDPNEPLEYSTTYAICITSGILYAGGTATAGLSFSFTTTAANELPAPQISSTSPQSNETGVSITTAVQAVFDMAMNSSTINTSTFTLATGGSAVSGSVSYDSSSNTATFTPPSSLSNLTAYTATLSSSIASAAGETLGSDYSWTFTTVAATVAEEEFSATPSVVVGHDHACALLADGTVKCWGRNDYGQLGTGTINSPTQSATAVTVVNQDGSPLTDVVEIAAADHTNFVRLSNGTVKGWGFNGITDSACIGDGSSEDFRDGYTNYPYPVSVIDASTNLTITGVTSLKASYTNACVIVNGGVKCWGDNRFGNVGKGSVDAWPIRITKATNVVGLGAGSNVRQIAVGTSAACTLLSDKKVRCWGRDTGGLLGQGSVAYCEDTPDNPCKKSTPDYVLTDADLGTPLTDIEEIYLQYLEGCGRKEGSGKYFCWGGNRYYNFLQTQLDAYYGVATEMTNLLGKTSLTFNEWSGCGIASGTVQCWGRNAADVGQLGISSMFLNNYTTAQDVHVGTTGTMVRATNNTNPNYFTCAVLTDDTVACWGANAYGQLGDGTTTNNATPVTVQDSVGGDLDLTP